MFYDAKKCEITMGEGNMQWPSRQELESSLGPPLSLPNMLPSSLTPKCTNREPESDPSLKNMQICAHDENVMKGFTGGSL